ncbi:unnamed protein product [Closterium sp. NIES-65]|nr:unnamed protein product [Closterium sp. NIES-65]
MNPLLSVLLSALISSLFVLSLYVWEVPRILRGAPPANRDDPRVVCQRITSVLGSCVASAAIVAAVAKFGLLDDTHAPLPSVPRLLSLQPDHLVRSIPKGIAIVACTAIPLPLLPFPTLLPHFPSPIFPPSPFLPTSLLSLTDSLPRIPSPPRGSSLSRPSHSLCIQLAPSPSLCEA